MVYKNQSVTSTEKCSTRQSIGLLSMLLNWVLRHVAVRAWCIISHLKYRAMLHDFKIITAAIVVKPFWI